MSDSVQPHRRQPTRLPRSWDSPGKNTGVGCHFLLQCMKVKSESEVAQLCPALSDHMDCSLPGSSVHGIFQARVLEWSAIAFSGRCMSGCKDFGRLGEHGSKLCNPETKSPLIAENEMIKFSPCVAFLLNSIPLSAYHLSVCLSLYLITYPSVHPSETHNTYIELEQRRISSRRSRGWGME